MGRSFEAAFEAEFASLHRYLARRLGASVADELAAETFAVAFRRWDRLDPERPVRPWLYGIAANLVRHHWRKERRMLRAYARTGVDPVFARDEEAVERANADAQHRELATALADAREAAEPSRRGRARTGGSLMTDDLLTSFRSEVTPPDDASAKRAYKRATDGRRRVPRRRLAYAIAAVVVAGSLAGGLGSTLGGASSNVNLQRQQIVNQAMTQVQQAFGGDRILKATLDGSLLTIDGKTDEPVNGVVEPFEELVLAHVADERLRAAGYEGIETINGQGFGGASLAPLSNIPQLSADACDIPAGTTLAEVTAASGRMIPLLRGFCVVHLTTSDPKAFAGYIQETLNQLFAAVPAAKGSQGRGVVIEADDTSGVPVIVIAWGPSTDQGGAVYVRPSLECKTSIVDPPVGRCGSGPGNG